MAVAALAAGLITAGPAALAAPPNSASATGQTDPADQAGRDAGVITLDGVAPGPKKITLITGDTATLTNIGAGPNQYSVTVDAAPRPDGHIPVFEGSFDEAKDAVYLYPDDARPAVESGVLDRDLFNLTYLAENGYTDADVDTVPVIAQYPKSQSMRALANSAQALPASEPEVELSSIHATGLVVSKADATDFWSAITPTTTGPGLRAKALPTGISKLWLDHKVSVSLDESVPMIGAPEAWGKGLDGTGVTVAVLDTGYDEKHPDLAGKVVAAKGFSFPLGTVHDGHGHGTHVASTIAGSGAASDGRYKGVAPGVDLMIGKVLNDTGQGVTSQVIVAMEWAANNGADIISMSLGAAPSFDDPAARAVDELTASTGALFVIAAGNDGPAEFTVGSPGIAESALTVAAVDKSDRLADFSSRGPRADGAMKPDIAAPGVAITAARSAGTDMDGGATVVDDFYDTASGTSMATPHVAGAAAILVQKHPDWTPAQIKSALMSTSKDDGYTAYEQGAGRVDITRAIDQTVFTTTPNADFGIVPNDAGPLTRQITYRNTGDTDLTLTLTPNLRQVGSDSTPDGALTVDDQVSVPAGGTATATVTLNSTDLALARYSGAIVATDETSGVHLTTPTGFQRRPPMHTLTINVLGRDGQPTTTSGLSVWDVTNQLGNFTFGSWVSTGVFKTQVPEGAIHVGTSLKWNDESRQNFGYLIAPEVEVTGDTEVTLDARKLQKFTFRTSRPAEVSPSGDIVTMGWERTLAHGLRVGGWVNAMFSYQLWATPTEPVKVGALQVSAFMALAAPEVVMRVEDMPDLALHPLNWVHRGTEFHTGFTGKLFTGTQTMPLVDAGVGRPEDLAGLDLTGKLALLDNGSQCDIPIDLLHDLRDAGAAGVLAWPSETFTGSGCSGGTAIPLGVGFTAGGDTDTNIGIPYASIAPGEARALRDRLAQDAVRITVTGTPVSPYVYEATPFELDQVSDSLTYDLTDRHVAKVDTEYHATEPTVIESDWLAYTANTGLVHTVYPPRVTAPITRTHYVGPLSDQVIHKNREYAPEELNSGRAIQEFHKGNLYDEPIRTREVWNEAAGVTGSLTYPDAIVQMDPGTRQLQHPNFAMCAMCREGDELYPVFHHVFGTKKFGIFNGSMNLIAPGLTHLYQGNREIPLNTEHALPSFTMPAGPGDYRMTLEDPTVRTKSEWTFRSQGTVKEQEAANGLHCPTAFSMKNPNCRAEPLVYATYDLGSRLGLDNKVTASGAHWFTVNAYHAPSRAQMPAIAGLRLWYSQDDGKTWERAQVKKNRNGQFDVKTVYALKGGTGTVSLKLQAWDKAGNTLTQTTLRAYELRYPTHHTGPTPQ